MRVIEWLPFRADARAVYYLNGEPFHLNAGTVVTRDTLPHADPFMGSRGLTPEQAKWLA